MIAGWQPRPHDGLRHPKVPRSALSPNEMYAALVASAGYLPLALSPTDYLELLPVAWRRITAEGIQLGYLTYDSDALNPLRGQSSGIAARSGRWEVHFDPYDLSRVWLRGGDEQWVSVAWIHAQRGTAPFADFTLRHVRRQLAERGDDDDDGQHTIAQALDDLLTRAGNGPTSIPRTSRRVAARTRAAAATPLRPNLTPNAEEVPAQAASPPAKPNQASNESSEGGVVIPFGVFDADREAERFW